MQYSEEKNRLSLIESNFSSLCRITSILTRSSHSEGEFYSWASNPADPWFSRIYDFRLAEGSAESILSEMKERIVSGELPPHLLITEQPGQQIINQILDRLGFQQYYQQTGMLATLKTAPPVNSGQNENIQIISDEESLTGWLGVIRQVFNSEKNPALYRQYLKHPDFTFYGYFIDGSMIATTLLYRSENIAGIHQVATLDRFRGKGIATALTRRAMADAFQQGADTAVLQSSPLGRRVYQNVGFQPVSIVSHWKI